MNWCAKLRGVFLAEMLHFPSRISVMSSLHVNRVVSGDASAGRFLFIILAVVRDNFRPELDPRYR